jgi:hypothetical protein
MYAPLGRTGPVWSYSGFHRFRTRIAESVGIHLDEMEGFCDCGILWDDIDDPIKYLLNHSDCDGLWYDHSDCDGLWYAWECREIYPRLVEILSSWPESDDDRIPGLELADMMKQCAKMNGIIVIV